MDILDWSSGLLRLLLLSAEVAEVKMVVDILLIMHSEAFTAQGSLGLAEMSLTM
jgi:hypothetical protein